MSKVVAVIVVMILMNVSMFMFTFSGECLGPDCEISDYNTEANSTIWAYFTNPSSQSQSGFWQKLFGSELGILAILTGGGLIVAGAVWLTKDINVAYVSLAIYIAAACIGTFARFWLMINDSGFVFGGQSGGVIAILTAGVLLATQLFCLIDWGRGR